MKKKYPYTAPVGFNKARNIKIYFPWSREVARKVDEAIYHGWPYERLSVKQFMQHLFDKSFDSMIKDRIERFFESHGDMKEKRVSMVNQLAAGRIAAQPKVKALNPAEIKDLIKTVDVELILTYPDLRRECFEY